MSHNPDSSSNPVRWVRGALIATGVLLVVTATLPLLPVNWWWVRIGDFPRLQLLLAYLFCAVALLPFCRRRGPLLVIAGLLCSAGIQLYWIYPYLPIAPLEVQSTQSGSHENKIRLMASNVLQDNEHESSAEALLALVDSQDPDVLVLCEVNERWLEQLASLDERFSIQVKHPLENTYGIALYSRLELEETRVRWLVEQDIPSIDTLVVLPSGHRVRLFAVHPTPPRPGQSTTNRDAELVLVGREVRDNPSAIVLGDMNDVGWSRTTNLFQEVSRLLDPRKGRGLYSTFDAHSAVWRYPLDYVFHSNDFRLVEIATLPPIGSDHLPLMVELSHEPDARAQQQAPDLDPDDRENAQEAVREAKEEQEE